MIKEEKKMRKPDLRAQFCMVEALSAAADSVCDSVPGIPPTNSPNPDFLQADILLIVAACGIQFPDQGSNLGPLHWEHSLNHWATKEVPPWPF